VKVFFVPAELCVEIEFLQLFGQLPDLPVSHLAMVDFHHRGYVGCGACEEAFFCYI
jgi:hypothetical protein